MYTNPMPQSVWDRCLFFYPFEIAATVPRVLHLSLVGVEKRPEPADPYHLSDKTDPKKGSELSLVGCSELIGGSLAGTWLWC